LKVPIFQGGAEYANIYSSGHERSAAKEEYEIAKESITKEVSKALDDYDFYQEFAKSSKDLSELAKERLQIFEKRTQMKVEDRVEFLRTQIEYNQYLAQCLESSAELTKSYYKIKYYAGEL
jgi:outer membrane protein TolC